MRVLVLLLACLLTSLPALAQTQPQGQAPVEQERIFQPGELAPRMSQSQLKAGDPAPDFTLPAIDGRKVSLSDYRGKQNVMISFIPAAWTPVCSDQWPGYCLAEQLFKEHDTVLLGVSVDSVPTLFAWTRGMPNLWFPVLSDFWPHGTVSQRYGVLREDGVSERAIFLVDKQGIIRYMDVHDINVRPELGRLVQEMAKLHR